jgi:hypothetical protein
MEILENAKEAIRFVKEKEIDNFELYRMILDLESEVMDVVLKLGELKKENASLKERLEIK